MLKFLMMVTIGVLATFNLAQAETQTWSGNTPVIFYQIDGPAPQRRVRAQPRKVVKPVQTARTRMIKPQLPPKPPVTSGTQSGMASYYWQGQRTANGERFDPEDMTAAHRTYPFNSLVKVTARNGKSVIVRINDRGPFVSGRIIDVSRAAARELGMISAGVAPVTVERIR